MDSSQLNYTAHTQEQRFAPAVQTTNVADHSGKYVFAPRKGPAIRPGVDARDVRDAAQTAITFASMF